MGRRSAVNVALEPRSTVLNAEYRLIAVQTLITSTIYYCMSEVISFRVRKELKEKDRTRMRIAALRTDQLRRRIPGWDGVQEIRRWREIR